MADLGLASSELAEDLGHTAGLDATSKEVVEILGASCDTDELASALVHFRSRGEAHWDKLGGFCKNATCLG